MTKRKNKKIHDEAVKKVSANVKDLMDAGILDPDYVITEKFTKPPFDKMTYPEMLEYLKNND